MILSVKGRKVAYLKVISKIKEDTIMNKEYKVENKSDKSIMLLIILGVMMMSDYLLTWYGINHWGIIEEGNPLLKWLFEIDFTLSLIVRIIMVCLVIVAIYILHKKSERAFKFVILFGITVNFIIMLLHFNWIIVLCEMVCHY